MFLGFRRYRIAFFAKALLTVVSYSASRTIFAIPSSKSNEISPIRRRCLLGTGRQRWRFSFTLGLGLPF